MIGRYTVLTAGLLLFTICGQNSEAQPVGQGWPTYGGDSGGQRFSSAAQITASNLFRLRPVWTYHTHALDVVRSGSSDASFETTPILADNTLYLTTPFDVVIALDATTGTERWTYDPELPTITPKGLVTSRGVAFWRSPNADTGAACQAQVFVATLDARLIALDASTGRRCKDFANRGEVDLKQGIALHSDGFYRMTSPPTVIGNIVVVGSGVGDNQEVDAESGLVRGFDAVSGKLLWSWEPVPWARAQKIPTGAANTWSIISADPALGIIYLPTGSASPDYFGGLRPGEDRDANSLVALDAATGRKVWSFQVVHHDLWDYDIASQPLLFAFRGDTPAVAVTTKMGLVFVLDRRTGKPLYPVHEQPVPQTDVPEETTWPTQPFPELPALNPLSYNAATAGSGQTQSPEDTLACRKQVEGLRNEGLYTPPSLRGSIVFPGNLGGVNWGSAAFDPRTGILYANTNRVAFTARLVPRYGREQNLRRLNGWFFDWANWGITASVVLAIGIVLRRRRKGTWIPGPITLSLTAILMATAVPISLQQEPGPQNTPHFGHELSEQRRSPYLILRDPILDLHGHPCSIPPWGAMSSLNLNTGKLVWESPLGSEIPGENTGAVNFGGPIVTAAGLVFTAAAEDPYLRAFDAGNGAELWKQRLPVPAQSTPMTYTIAGKQYIVIAAGGHANGKLGRGDSLIAFALQD